jgi:hypothetical protein
LADNVTALLSPESGTSVSREGAGAEACALAARLAAAAASRLQFGEVRAPDLASLGLWRETSVGVPRPAARAALVGRLRALAGEHDAVWLHGADGLGKTALAGLVARAIGGVWRTLDLSGATPGQAIERLAVARESAASADLAGVVVDDLDPGAEAALASLAQSLRRRGAACLVTSRAPPPGGALAGAGVLAAPPFDEGEIGPLIAAYGGDPIGWTRFVHIAGGLGHPQRVAALVASLAARGWPAEEPARWASAGHRPDDPEPPADPPAAERRRAAAAAAVEILARKAPDAGQLDTAFAQALAARAEPLALRVAQAVLAAEPAQRTALALAMPRLRGVTDADLPPGASPNLRALVQAARLRLVTPLGAAPEIAAALQAALGALPGAESPADVLALILGDPCAFGRLPGWFDLVTRLEKAGRRPAGAAKRPGDAASIPPIGPLFAGHAARPDGLSALEALFQALDAATPALRRRRLKALTAERAWLTLAVDGAWLADAARNDLDGLQAAQRLARLGDMAMGWGEPVLAARAFKAAAVMLDDVAEDADAALAVLDAADRKIPDDLDLTRERAHVAFRAEDYARALALVAAIAERLAAADPLDAALAFREAAVSAAQLGQRDEASQWFRRAAALSPPPPFGLALSADAAAARFAAGDRLAAVREMAGVLDGLTGLRPAPASLTGACAQILRAMEAALDGQELPCAPGVASRPLPEPALADPILADRPDATWARLARLALRLDAPAAEVRAWPAVPPILAHAPLGVDLRAAFYEQALRQRDLALCADTLASVAEGLTWRDNNGDEAGDIPAIPPAALIEPTAHAALRDALLAMGAALVLPAEPAAGLAELTATARAIAGFDAMPEWTGAPAPDPQTWIEDIAQRLAQLSTGKTLELIDIFTLHLRLFEWLRQSAWRRALAPIVADRVRRDWAQALEARAEAFRAPVPAVLRLRAALDRDPAGLGFVADVLLAAVPALNLDLWPDMLEDLRRTAAG